MTDAAGSSRRGGSAPGQAWGPVADELAADVRRVSDRLRSLSRARLAAPPRPPQPAVPPSGGAPVPPGGGVPVLPGGVQYESCAQAGRAVAQSLADTAAALEAVAAGAAPALRELPRLADFAVGDQVAVTGHDLLAALALAGPDAPVGPETSGRLTAAEAVASAGRQLADVRRRI